MYDYKKYEKIIRSRLSQARFYHSLCVAESAELLAVRFGGDRENARLAGILHDIMKEESLEVQYSYIKNSGERLSKLELNSPNVIHQMSGCAYCREELCINDSQILDAIRWHTTGKRSMSLLSQIVYTADFISADRNYPDVEKMRCLAEKSLDEAMLYSLKYTLKKLSQSSSLIHPDTLECYNWLLEKKIKD